MKSRFVTLVTWTPVICIICCLIIGPILREGMFLDGLVYTNIARNLSDGIGSFWSPLYSKYGQIFYEHPPLLFYVQSLLFNVFGNTTLTEDIYNFIVFISTLYLIASIWKIETNKDSKHLFVFPILFFVLGQEVQLRYPNTMLECGMTLIILLTTFLYLKTNKGKYQIVSLVVIGVGGLLAFLSKGPPGLFVLAIPGIYQFVLNNKFSITSIVIPFLVFLSLIGGVFLIINDSFDFITQYFDQQVIAAIKGERTENIASYRLRFIELLIMSNLPAIIMASVIGVSVKTKKPNDKFKAGIFYIIVGCSSIFPLIVSIKQASYYQIPSIPFFALGIALLLKEKILNLSRSIQSIKKGVVAIKAVCIIICVSSLLFSISRISEVDKRDAEIIQSVNNLKDIIKEYDTDDDSYRLEFIGSQKWKGEEKLYRMIAYLMRYCDLHLDNDEPKFVVKIKTDDSNPSIEGTIYEDQVISVSYLK